MRRSTRHEVVLPAKVRIAPEHAQSVRFAKGVTDPEGWIECDLIDFAVGGAGFVSEVFLPRGASVELLIPEVEPGKAAMLEINCRVMRVRMTDRRPAYLLGIAFTDQRSETQRSVEAILDRLEGVNDESESEC